MVKIALRTVPFLFLLSVIALCGCSKKTTPTTMAYRSYDTECLSKDPSGNVTLRVWGEGSDNKSACNNAAKKAVEEIIFSNIAGNKANVLPIIPSPTARTKHRDYFNKFFDGKHNKYVKSKNAENDGYSGNNQVVVPVIVTVDREGLIDRLKKDKVLE